MEDNLRKLVKENTIHEKYKLNNASQLGHSWDSAETGYHSI